MSFEQLNVFMEEMVKINRFESGEAPPMSAKAQREIAQAMCRKKKDG